MRHEDNLVEGGVKEVGGGGRGREGVGGEGWWAHVNPVGPDLAWARCCEMAENLRVFGSVGG